MSVDFRPIIPDPAPTPNRGNYTNLQPFRFWCQKVLPLVYDESLSYYELLCKVVDYLNKTMEDVGILNDDIGTLYDAFTSLTGWTEDQIEALLTAYSELQDYVNNYFDNLNVQTEINNKLDAMAAAGTLTTLLSPFVPAAVASWLAAHVDPSTGYVIDNTLSIAGAAADAKAAGDALDTKAPKRWIKSQTFTNDDLTRSGYILATNGTFSPTDNAICSERIDIREYDSLDILTSIGDTGLVAAFYDATWNFISGVSVAGESANILKRYHVDLTGSGFSNVVYVRFSCYGPSRFEYFQAIARSYVDEGLEGKLDNNATTILIPEFTAGGYILASDGTLSPSVYGKYTDKISLAGYKSICYRGRLTDAGNLITFYDINNTYLADISITGEGNTTELSGVIDLLSDEYSAAYYAIFSMYDTHNDFSMFYYAVDKGINMQYAADKQISEKYLKGKTINAFGDSITSTDYYTPNWWQQIAMRTGAEFNNYGVSGTSIAKKENRSDSFCERLENLDENADAVIMMGGTNDGAVPLGTWDSEDQYTFYGALNYIITTLLENFGGKPILICTPIQRKGDYEINTPNALATLNSTAATATVTQEIRAEAIKAKCHQYGVPCLDLFSNSGISGVNDIYYLDTLHPSAYGQYRLGDLIQSEIEKFFI